MTMVYVQNKDGKPLMPTTRYCYVRLLLKENKARVVCTTPFTIQLNYDTPEITQDLILGRRTGFNEGMCASRTERRHGFHSRLKTKFCGKTHQILNIRKREGVYAR